jgi:hypothetical protein
VLVRVTPEGRATSGESALRLLRRAVSHGHTVGVRLRLGERVTDARAWNDTLRAVSRLRWHLECDDQDLRTVDLGRLPGDAELVRFVARSTDLHLGPDLPRVLFESELSHRRRPRR